MRLKVTVNDGVPVCASLQSKGWLSAHVNLELQDGWEKTSGRVFINAIDQSGEPNAVFSTWEVGDIAVDDKVQIEVLADGEAEPPTKVRLTSESPKNLFQETENARALLLAIRSFDTALMEILERARERETQEEFMRIARAFVAISSEIDRELIMPTLRRHPELVEEAERIHIYKKE
jgi:hypothetical protein